jgi:hypothetical protein
VEPGSIFKRKDSIKVATVSSDIIDVIAQLDYIEIEKIDKDGNTVTVKVY